MKANYHQQPVIISAPHCLLRDCASTSLMDATSHLIASEWWKEPDDQRRRRRKSPGPSPEEKKWYQRENLYSKSWNYV